LSIKKTLKSNQDFAENLQSLINKSGLKPAEIARKTGVPPESLSRYLSGERVPKGKNLLSLSTYFKTDPNWLLNGNIRSAEEIRDRQLKQMGQELPTDPFKPIGMRLMRLHKWVASADEKETVRENAKSVGLELEMTYKELVDVSNSLLAESGEPYETDRKNEKIIMLLEKENSRLDAEIAELKKKMASLEESEIE
jgi:transcriptional regulator with XRE-family HTH domain